jgi:3,4-dihydroxy 2-butanone 4-phosphate synthase/GTP cyclohydrolase II
LPPSGGEIVIVVDDEDRENEGDLIMAAEFATPEALAFFLHHTSGVICVSITAERAAELDLGPMVLRNTETQRTCLPGLGRSPRRNDDGHLGRRPGRHHPRPHRPDHPARDLLRPGHLPQAREGGVLKRAGHTEATRPGPIGRLPPPQASCARSSTRPSGAWPAPDLETFAARHGLVMSIADLIRYRRRTEQLVDRIDEIMPHRVGPVPLCPLPQPPRRR